MIKTGDRFTYKDLTQSIHELCSADMRKYLRKSNIGVAVGETLVLPSECSPDAYAAACIREYQNIPSSAIYLDTQLCDKGYKTTHRFAHKYNGGGLSTQQIIHDAYCLDWFNQIYNTAQAKKQYQEQYLGLIKDAFSVSYFYAQYMWAYNRPVCQKIAQQLQSPNPTQWGQIIGAILGVGFQFHPDDVYEYAVEHVNPSIDKKHFDARYAQQSEFKNHLMDNYGIDTGCLVLSPKSRDKLQKIVTHTDTPYWLQIITSLFPYHNR